MRVAIVTIRIDFCKYVRLVASRYCAGMGVGKTDAHGFLPEGKAVEHAAVRVMTLPPGPGAGASLRLSGP